jgi:hypothetical protein
MDQQKAGSGAPSRGGPSVAIDSPAGSAAARVRGSAESTSKRRESFVSIRDNRHILSLASAGGPVPPASSRRTRTGLTQSSRGVVPSRACAREGREVPHAGFCEERLRRIRRGAPSPNGAVVGALLAFSSALSSSSTPPCSLSSAPVPGYCTSQTALRNTCLLRRGCCCEEVVSMAGVVLIVHQLSKAACCATATATAADVSHLPANDKGSCLSSCGCCPRRLKLAIVNVDIPYQPYPGTVLITALLQPI